MTARNGLVLMPGGLEGQDGRLDEMAEAHPEVDWLGRKHGIYSAYVRLDRGGWLTGADTLCELLDKLDEFFEGTESDGPDTG